MQASKPQNGEARVYTDLTNQQFLERHARVGCIGLSGGDSLIDKAICRAERHLDEEARWGSWSHAFVFQGVRADGHHWVIESDLQIHRRHLQLGVQENRVSKYFNEAHYSTLAILDFGLSAEQTSILLREGLELVANRERYSLRELLGIMIAMRRQELRGKDNLLARDRSVFCSALVQYLYRKAGVDLAPGVSHKHTAPEDLSRTPVPHTRYLLHRDAPTSSLNELKQRLKRRVQARMRLRRRKHAG